MVHGKENRPLARSSLRSSPLSRANRRVISPRSSRPGSPTKPDSPKKSTPSRRGPGGDRHPQRNHVLIRPETVPVRPEAVAAMLPESLETVDCHWIRLRLQNKGRQMWDVLSDTNITTPHFPDGIPAHPSGLPPFYHVTIDRPTVHPPTHIFAVYESGRTGTVRLLCFHGLLAALEFAKLPTLPPPAVWQGHSNGTFTAILPVVPLGVPDFDAFAFVARYIYGSNSSGLHRFLCRVHDLPPAAQAQYIPGDLANLTRIRALYFSVDHQLRDIERYENLWKTARVLGFSERDFMISIETAHSIALDALRMTTEGLLMTPTPI